ncbi:MAG: hypothetical protein JOZ25_12110 [Actinobacteria bacterium]|nr:hypothetical protein [Actinomycetota bacterium]
MLKAGFTLAALALAAVATVALLEEVDRLLHHYWPLVLVGLALWLVVRNPFGGRI